MDKIINYVLQLAQGNFSQILDFPDTKDKITSIRVALNLLTEELRESAMYSNFVPFDREPEPHSSIIYIINEHGKIDFVNQYGISELDNLDNKLIGTDFSSLLSRDSQEEWERILAKMTIPDATIDTVVTLGIVTREDQVRNRIYTLYKPKGMNIIIISLKSSARNLTHWIIPDSDHTKIKLRPEDKLMLMEVKKYLNDNLDQSFMSLKKMAEIFGTNEFRIKSGFKILFDIPISTYFHQKKLRMTTAMIIESDLPISTIVYKMGYKSLTQFYNTFNDKFGIPPGQYRKLYKKQ